VLPFPFQTYLLATTVLIKGPTSSLTTSSLSDSRRFTAACKASKHECCMLRSLHDDGLTTALMRGVQTATSTTLHSTHPQQHAWRPDANRELQLIFMGPDQPHPCQWWHSCTGGGDNRIPVSGNALSGSSWGVQPTDLCDLAKREAKGWRHPPEAGNTPHTSLRSLQPALEPGKRG